MLPLEGIIFSKLIKVFPLSSVVNSLTAMQETWFPSLGWEDHLEKEMTTHSNILAWRIPLTEEPDRLQPRGGHN